MANWTLSGGTKNGVAMELYASEQSQSIGDNRTQLYWELRGWLTTDNPAQWFSNRTNDIAVIVNGVTVFSRAYTNEALVSIGTDTNAGKKKVIASGTALVEHDASGSKTCPVSFSFAAHWNPGTYTWTAARDCPLTMIARASVPTLSAAGTEMGSAVTITTNRASTGFTHTVRYAFGSASGTIASGVGASTSWTIPLTLAKQIPNSTSGSGLIYVDTYSGGTLIGTQSVAFTATVPSNVVPTLSVAVAEAASIPSGISGYVQGRSKLKVTSTGAGTYGASIKSYAVTVDGISYSGSSITTNTLSSSGTLTIKVTVTDSRGRTASATKSITVAAYSVPKLTGVTAYRCASSSSTTADDEGAYICVFPKGSVTGLNGTNGRTCTVYYKKASETAYSSKSLTMGDYTLDTEYAIFAADINSSYNLYVTLADSFSGSTATYIAPQVTAAAAYIFIPAARDGIAFGKRLEGPAFDVAWDALFRRALLIAKDAKAFDVRDFCWDTGWVALELEDGLTQLSYIKSWIRRAGKQVEVIIGCTGVTKSWTKVATLPEGYRPPVPVPAYVTVNNKIATAANIDAAGVITITESWEAFEASKPVVIHATFFAA